MPPLQCRDPRSGTSENSLMMPQRMYCVLGLLKTVVEAWCGVRPRASGRLPLLGAMPGWRGWRIAVGHGSNGFLRAPITAQAIAAQLGTEQLPAGAAACEYERRMSGAESVVTRRAA